MATVAVGTPLAEALSNAIQPKLVEMGWSSDSSDSALTEYVILMLVNGKTQEQIASELSNDLLGLGEGDTQALDFSRWLFEQVETFNREINGQPATTSSENAQAIPSFNDKETIAPQPQGFENGFQSFDTNMGDVGPAGDGIPTGPKSMRNSRQGNQSGRGRMLNQINRNLDRGDAGLHRIRDQTGGGRINSHGRGANRGGRFNQNGNGRMPGGRQMGGMGMGVNPMAGDVVMNMNSNDQMHLMSLLEEQARMMAQFMPGFVSPAINPAFQQTGPQRSLSDRVEHPRGPRQQGAFGNRTQHANSNPTDTGMDTSPDQETQNGGQDENNTDNVCHFNLRCTRRDCPFAHQSPAAAEGTPIDVSDPCSYGAACKNRKCTGRHPSPAVKSAHQAEENCRFFPNCTNPHCHFKHPSMPLCRNGADCSTTDCKFTHLQVSCRFNPCLNPTCPYKHADGQRGAFPDKVWTADSAQGKARVSERKFVHDEDAPEELIKPGAGADTSSQEIVT